MKEIDGVGVPCLDEVRETVVDLYFEWFFSAGAGHCLIVDLHLLRQGHLLRALREPWSMYLLQDERRASDSPPSTVGNIS